MHAIVGLKKISDTQCGFKFFRRDVAQGVVSSSEDGRLYVRRRDPGTCATALLSHLRNVPIRWHDDGDSRLLLVRDNFRHAIDIFKIRRAIKRNMRASSVTEQSDFDSR